MKSRLRIGWFGNPCIGTSPRPSKSVYNIRRLIRLKRRGDADCEVPRSWPTIWQPKSKRIDSRARRRRLYSALGNRRVHLLGDGQQTGSLAYTLVKSDAPGDWQDHKSMKLFFERDLEIKMNELLCSRLQRHIDRGENDLWSCIAWA